MKIQGKTLLVLTLLTMINATTFGQKAKKTHDHEKFAKKALMSMAYIDKMCVDDAAMSYISDKSGTTIDELKTKRAADLVKLQDDVKFIMDNSIYGVMGSIELTNVKESPVKTADIVVNYTNKGDAFQFVLTNCVQTNISWYMGDGIVAAGDGIKDLIAKREAAKEKAENGLLGQLAELEEKQNEMAEEGKKHQAHRDSVNAMRKGHFATLFPMQGTDKSSKYYKHDLTNMPLDGYYVLNDGSVVNAVIAYQKPEFLVGDFAESSSLVICKQANGTAVDVLNVDSEPNFSKFVPKNTIQAFFVGGQLYANINKVGWRIVTSEGAIHTFVNIVKVTTSGGSSYQAFEQTQKREETALGSVFGGPSAAVVLEMMEDCPEIVQEHKDKNRALYETIVKYNGWYDLAYPEKVKYIPSK